MPEFSLDWLLSSRVRRVSVIRSEFGSFPPLALVYRASSPVPDFYTLDSRADGLLRTVCDVASRNGWGAVCDYGAARFVPGWDWDITRSGKGAGDG